MGNDVIILEGVALSGTDELGDPVSIPTRREVFARVFSVGQAEFYQAQAVGLKPEIKFVLSDYLDYEGEQVIIHNGERLRVLRTYRKGLELEVTAYREVNMA